MRFTLSDTRRVTLWAANKCPVTFEEGGGIDARNVQANGEPIGIAVRANRDYVEPGPWEILHEHDLGHGKVALSCRAIDGSDYFMTAEDGGGGHVSTNRKEIGAWETWTKVANGFLSVNGYWLCCEIGSADPIVNCTRTQQGPWETFGFEYLDRLPIESAFPPEAGRLRRDGTFIRANDAPWTCRGFSLFLDYYHFCKGGLDAIVPGTVQLRELGFNTKRVFGPLPWKEVPDYRAEHFDFTKLSEYFAFNAEMGMRVEFNPICYVYTQREREEDQAGGGRVIGLPFDIGEQRKLTQIVYDAAAPFEIVLVQVANEPHVNDTNPQEIMRGVRRNGVFSSYGYYNNEIPSREFPKFSDGYGNLHSDRDRRDWARKFRHAEEMEDAWGIPIILDEPRGAGEPGVTYPSARDTNVANFVQYHAGAAFWTAGSVLHTEEGKWGRVPQPGMRQHDIMTAVSNDVWKRIGPEWQFGQYNGSHMSSSPVDFIRDVWTYSTILGNRALSVRVSTEHPGPKAVRGWRVVDRWGPLGTDGQGTIVLLER